MKIRVDLKEKESDQQNGIVFLDGNQTHKVWVAIHAVTTDLRLNQACKFRATLLSGLIPAA